jgi:hypothetical protein
MRRARLGPAHHRVGAGSASDGERDEERGLSVTRRAWQYGGYHSA